LNYLAYALSVADTGKDPPPDELWVEFPIYRESAHFAEKHKVRKLSKQHLAAIESVQPYRGRKELQPLRVLNQLAIINRHRKLNLVGAIPTEAKITAVAPKGTQIEWLAVWRGAIKDGRVVARYRVIGPPGVGYEITLKPNVTVDIAVHEPTTGHMPLRDLQVMHNLVVSIVQEFDREFETGVPIGRVHPFSTLTRRRP
jgi:hypothetical protein